MKKRSSKGNVTQEAKNKYGFKKGEAKGKYPVFDVKSALSAIKLRHHSDAVSPKKVLDKVALSPVGSNYKVKEALKKARAVDKKK
jgi:hypothetical protein